MGRGGEKLTHVSSSCCGKGNGIATASVARDAATARALASWNCMFSGNGVMSNCVFGKVGTLVTMVNLGFKERENYEELARET